MQTNPLVSYRQKLGLSQEDFAGECGVGPLIVKLHEKGIPHHFHPRMIDTFPDIVELIPAYQNWRLCRRQRNFSSQSVVPENGQEFAQWLAAQGLSINEFSELACMPQIDISYALHHWRIPSTIKRFFEEINASRAEACK